MSSQIQIQIPAPFRAHVAQQKRLELTAETVGEALRILVSKYPNIKAHLFDQHARIRPFINVYLNDEDIRYLNGELTNLEPGDELTLVPSVSGG